MFLDLLFIMKILAELTKDFRSITSAWQFCQRDDRFFAINQVGKRINCRDLDDLRRLYKRMLGYGYMAMPGAPVVA